VRVDGDAYPLNITISPFAHALNVYPDHTLNFSIFPSRLTLFAFASNVNMFYSPINHKDFPDGVDLWEYQAVTS